MTEVWRALLDDARRRLRSEVDARRIIERASGREGAELALVLDEPAPGPAAGHARDMVARRAAGEPLQYVVGRWGFRGLDLYVDRRVLIPRPETEVVVDVALSFFVGLPRVGRATSTMNGVGGQGRAGAPVAVDLGTGSGAIALALAVELPTAEVWGTDRSEDALAVARANLAGIGRAASRVRLVAGEWFDALPAGLRGGVDLVVANPPYVAEGEALPAEVADWEPPAALFAGPTGLEAIALIVEEAPAWLTPATGVLVCEIAPHQSGAVLDVAHAAGFTAADVRPDLAGRARVLVAR